MRRIRATARSLAVATVTLALLTMAGTGSAQATDQVAGSPGAFEQPQVRMRVTPVVELVAASTAAAIRPRGMRHDLTSRLKSAPVIAATAGRPAKIVVSGLVPIGSYMVKVKTYGQEQRFRDASGYAPIGAITADRFGQTQLPVFTPMQVGGMVIALVARTGDTAYVKVIVD